MLGKRIKWKRLSTQLLAAVIAALLLAGTVLFVFNSALSEWFYRYSTNDAFAHREEQRYADKLQAYVDQHELSGTDTDALDQWLRDHRSVLVILRRDGQPIYNAGLLWTEEASADDAPVAQYEVQFADGPAQATFLCFFENYYFAITILSLLLSFVVFVAVLLTLIRKKTRYITRMRDELRILEGGDLEYTVAVRGEDELADLARGINDMRQAVISRQQDEQEAREANHALVTAMSHDLRTPLTALIGYLDIMTMQKCKNEEEHARFLALSRSKAQQIKEMSDRLFQYFLVYDREGQPLDLQAVDAASLLGQTMEEGLFELESRGFTVERNALDFSGRLYVNVELFRRLIDNLISNVGKYGDSTQLVRAEYRIEQGMLTIGLHNAVRQDGNRPESTRIGLKTCEKIARDHGGTFTSETDGQMFSVCVSLPCEEK